MATAYQLKVAAFVDCVLQATSNTKPREFRLSLDEAIDWAHLMCRDRFDSAVLREAEREARECARMLGIA